MKQSAVAYCKDQGIPLADSFTDALRQLAQTHKKTAV